ncbi:MULTISPECIES: KPN_02809 family neutral zinc metallopeptidase [Candidatus Neomicrothrix]|uniref:Metalloprotease n=1 Tax=Candidatus Neomicrothrix parvicella RN1 TaxID=1229780 RepID=R4Z6T4_9ACTN|nr:MULTISPECIES: neutral zinc metallopeptidase [Microthrix]MBP6134108.1 zinc metallopeptidase [Candidatus Microthrix sp.]MBP6150320.1 zinc metallopeptidase [Candidatus Microthrix sp.]MBP7876853.1 zinc metallopeptidase [Candidatus Microthrix sp.]MBP7987795.1 zinc metallopeptidase [Candidatus Microthrix sp.]MBP7993262.1 zinc metallopeptidase [Candidatus Microthrix sp.]
MKWDQDATPDMSNVDDQRSSGGAGGGFQFPLPGGGGRGGGMGLPIGKGSGILGIVIALAAIFILPRLTGGGDLPFNVEQMDLPGAVPEASGPTGRADDAPTDETGRFIVWVFNDVQRTWTKQFAEGQQKYSNAKLNLFRNSVNTGCGQASSAVGPFYCPADSEVYIDETFFDELADRFGAPGDFAQAYVVAHEMGHHVQNVLGISDDAQRLSRKNPDQANALSIRLELQADCLAGVWARNVYLDDSANRGLEQGDIEEGLGAASAVGDDRIQEQATGRIDPETWNHGSSEQRVKWFKVGFDNGQAEQCDTFGVDRP